MTAATIYGIKNCETVKKALRWLDEYGVNYHFHDYKKRGVDADVLQTAFDQHGWDNVINRRGRIWRQLPEEYRENMDKTAAFALAQEKPGIIKRPLLLRDGAVHLGFDPDAYARLFETD